MLNLINIHQLYQSQISYDPQQIRIDKSPVILKDLCIGLVLRILGSCLSLHDKAFHIVCYLLDQLVKFLDVVDLGFLEEIEVLIEKCLNGLSDDQLFLLGLKLFFLFNSLNLSIFLLEL